MKSKRHEMTSMWRNDVTSTSVGRHFDVMCPLGFSELQWLVQSLRDMILSHHLRELLQDIWSLLHFQTIDLWPWSPSECHWAQRMKKEVVGKTQRKRELDLHWYCTIYVHIVVRKAACNILSKIFLKVDLDPLTISGKIQAAFGDFVWWSPNGNHMLWPLIWTVSSKRLRWGVTIYALCNINNKHP